MCCWTGTGASIAANKVRGIRAALCTDAQTAAGARKWNDANVLALSLRLLSEPLATEIVDAWLDTDYDGTEDESLARLTRRERRLVHPAAEPRPRPISSPRCRDAVPGAEDSLEVDLQRVAVRGRRAARAMAARSSATFAPS